MPETDRSGIQRARLDARRWGQEGGWSLGVTMGVLPLLIGGIVGLKASEWGAAILAVLASTLMLYIAAFLVFLAQAPSKALDAVLGEADKLRKEVRDLQASAPKLALGPVLLPEQDVKFALSDHPHHWLFGRVLQVPVSVSRGSEPARSVRARLNFRPDDQTGWMSPRNPFFAEWNVDDDSLPTVVDIPSNGQPIYFNVAFVAGEGHPAVFVWTKESRNLELAPKLFGIAGPAKIHVEVSGAGHGAAAPHVEDMLSIDMYNGMLNATWASADPEESQPGVPRPERSFMPPPGS